MTQSVKEQDASATRLLDAPFPVQAEHCAQSLLKGKVDFPGLGMHWGGPSKDVDGRAKMST